MRAVFTDTSLTRDLTPKPEAQVPHGLALGPHSHQSPPLQSRSHSHSSSPHRTGCIGSAEPSPRPSSSSDLRPPLRLRTPGGGSPARLPASLPGSQRVEGESCVSHKFVMAVGRSSIGVAAQAEAGTPDWWVRHVTGSWIWRESRSLKASERLEEGLDFCFAATHASWSPSRSRSPVAGTPIRQWPSNPHSLLLGLSLFCSLSIYSFFSTFLRS